MIRAVGNNIICKPIFGEVNKIIITNAQRMPLYYEVDSVGQEVKYIVEKDKILIKTYLGELITYEGNEYYILPFDGITAKII